MKTAVEWLIEQIKSDQYQKALSLSEWMKVFEQAKEMEKEQIRDAYEEGYNRVAKLIEDATQRNL
jgi:hypothetical protein